MDKLNSTFSIIFWHISYVHTYLNAVDEHMKLCFELLMGWVWLRIYGSFWVPKVGLNISM